MMNISRELKVTNISPINITVRLVEEDGHPGMTRLEVHIPDTISSTLPEDSFQKLEKVGCYAVPGDKADNRKEEYRRRKLERIVSDMILMIRTQIMDCLEAGGAFHE